MVMIVMINLRIVLERVLYNIVVVVKVISVLYRIMITWLARLLRAINGINENGNADECGRETCVCNLPCCGPDDDCLYCHHGCCVLAIVVTRAELLG